MIANDYAIVLSDDDTFSQYEAPEIMEKFVCGVCHGPLYVVDLPNDPRAMVICPEHGNVTQCGRVTPATVSIELENAYKNYYSAIRALPDLWGELAEQGFEYRHATRIIHDYVCAVCGGQLTPYTRPHDSNVNVRCPSHGNVDLCGYTLKHNFTWDFKRMKAWEKEHPRK